MRIILSLAALLFAASCGQPADHGKTAPAPNTLSVSDGWASPTPNGVDVSAGYLIITNGTAVADRLVAITSPAAGEVQLHDMNMDAQGVMEMRQITALDIPAGAVVALSPGGKHIMFMGAFPPFAEGDHIPVHLTFEHAGPIDVTLDVRQGPPEHAH
jgi:copper(I)-binding protein